MLRIENVATWPAERLEAAMPSIRACVQRFVDEAPEALTVGWLFDEVVARRRQMWVIFDEDAPDVAVMVGIGEIQHYYATGYQFLALSGLGGARLEEAWPLVEEVYAWAREHGAQACHVIGRKGWERHLRKRGYSVKSVTLKLVL